jgi:hypothetical protein
MFVGKSKTVIVQISWVLLLIAQAGCQQGSDAPVSNTPALKESYSPSLSPVQAIPFTAQEKETAGFKPENIFKSEAARQLAREFHALEPRLIKTGDHLVLFAKIKNSTSKDTERIEVVKDYKDCAVNCLGLYVFLLDASRHVLALRIPQQGENGYEQEDFLFSADGSVRYYESFTGSEIDDADWPNKIWIAVAFSAKKEVLERAEKYTDIEGAPWQGPVPESADLPPLQLKQIIEKEKLGEALKKANL